MAEVHPHVTHEPMRNTYFTLLLSVGLLMNCTSDNEEDLFDQDVCDETVSLTTDVQPIVNNNCAVSGCHVSGAQSPDLSTKQNIIDRASRIKQRTQSRSMPPPGSGITLTDEEIAILGCWVDNGANDN